MQFRFFPRAGGHEAPEGRRRLLRGGFPPSRGQAVPPPGVRPEEDGRQRRRGGGAQEVHLHHPREDPHHVQHGGQGDIRGGRKTVFSHFNGHNQVVCLFNV